MIRTLVEARDKNKAVDNVINRNGGKPSGKDAQSAMYWGDSEVMNNLRSIVEKLPQPMQTSSLQAKTEQVKRC